MENQTKANFEHALKWGLIFGLINIAAYLLMFLINKNMLVSMWFGSTTFIVNLALLIFSITSQRKELGGFISFNQAFIICFVVFIGGALIQNIFSYFLYNFIDPGLAEFIKQKAIETTSSMMEKFGAPQESIDKSIDDMQNENFSQTPARISLQFFYSIIYGGFISLILAAIFKKNPKVVDFE